MNNTFVNTDGVELLVQFDTRNNVIANNVIVAGPAHASSRTPTGRTSATSLDHNLYYSHDGSPVGPVAMERHRYTDFDAWQARLGERPHDRCSPTPGSRDSGRGGLFARARARRRVDAGAFLAAAGATDI